jgi:hypothetical protein
VCGTKNFVSVRLYSAPQSHWTIVAILRIWAYGEPVQAEFVRHNQTGPVPFGRAKAAREGLATVRLLVSRRQLALLDPARGGISWFEFIVFHRDIVIGGLFGGHQFLGKAAPKIALRCFHQPGHQIFRHSVDRSILIDFGVDRISEAICRDAIDENANLPTV